MANPIFITDTGIELNIRPIGQLIIRRFDIEYKKGHQEPEAPIQVLDDPAKTEYRNENDLDFVSVHSEWEDEYNSAILEFLLEYGVKSSPPDGWENPFPVGEDANTKILWLESVLIGPDLEWDNHDSVMNVIMGMKEVTETGIEEAKKN